MYFPRYPVRDRPDKNLALRKRRIVSAIDMRNKKDDVQEGGRVEGNEEDMKTVTERGGRKEESEECKG